MVQETLSMKTPKIRPRNHNETIRSRIRFRYGRITRSYASIPRLTDTIRLDDLLLEFKILVWSKYQLAERELYTPKKNIPAGIPRSNKITFSALIFIRGTTQK